MYEYDIKLNKTRFSRSCLPETFERPETIALVEMVEKKLKKWGVAELYEK